MGIVQGPIIQNGGSKEFQSDVNYKLSALFPILNTWDKPNTIGIFLPKTKRDRDQ
jgi:hypothetical protein